MKLHALLGSAFLMSLISAIPAYADDAARAAPASAEANAADGRLTLAEHS